MASSNRAANRDASDRASDMLDFVLDDTSESTQQQRAEASAVSVELKKQQILEQESVRIKSRVLFITSDTHVFEKDSVAAQEYMSLEEVFDEVHVLVLGRPGTVPGNQEAVRLSTRVWAYPLPVKFFLTVPFWARAYAADELTFTDGFRPDLVVARDPFESAIAGVFIANKYERLLQVQVTTDEWLDEDKFTKKDALNRWRLHFLKYALKRADSVRVATSQLQEAVKKVAPKQDDIAVLPRYFHTRELLSLSRTADTNLFPQFVFTIMAIGEFTVESTIYRVLDAVRVALQTPTVGLVVIGDGPLREQFKQRAQLFGIQKQVLFLGKVEDYTDHLRSADVLMVTDTDTASDDLVVKAAALGVPMIMAKNQLRTDLFEDGHNAFLCDPDATHEFTTQLRKFLNANALRVQFSEGGREVVRTRIEEDPRMYRLSYRNTIEDMLYKASAEESGKAAAAVAVATPAVVEMDGIPMRVPQEMREEMDPSVDR